MTKMLGLAKGKCQVSFGTGIYILLKNHSTEKEATLPPAPKGAGFRVVKIMNTVKDHCIRRAEALASARSFFAQRGLIEVDPIALSTAGSVDVNIDLFVTHSAIHGDRFLFSSPEYPMKRLLSQGSGDIFYLGHVWRHEGAGKNHSPEFLMAEWYRVGMPFSDIIEETVKFAELFIGNRQKTYLTYQEAFVNHAHIDPFNVSDKELVLACKGFEGYPINESSRDELLNLILAMHVEPKFNRNDITILTHYPASQAALARHVIQNGTPVAERFEMYCEGLELANGYHELADSVEQHSRFEADNNERIRLSKPPYPIDKRFLSALKNGLPDCCGVAVGMDRLLMIREKSPSISAVIPINWAEA